MVSTALEEWARLCLPGNLLFKVMGQKAGRVMSQVPQLTAAGPLVKPQPPSFLLPDPNCLSLVRLPSGWINLEKLSEDMGRGMAPGSVRTMAPVTDSKAVAKHILVMES